jgi:hypothetical protein
MTDAIRTVAIKSKTDSIIGSGESSTSTRALTKPGNTRMIDNRSLKFDGLD